MNTRSNRFILLGGRAAALALAASAAQAATYTWTKTAAGAYDWNVNANWSPNTGFPNAAGDVASFTANAAGAETVRLNLGTITVGTLNLGDSNTSHAYTIDTSASGQVLVLDNGASPAQINQTANSRGDTIAAPMRLKGDLVVANASATTTRYALTLSGAVESGAASGTQTITVTGVYDTTLSGALGNGGSGGTLALVKLGTPTLALTAANGFTGGLTLRAGAVTGTAQSSGSPFGGGANAVTVGGADPLTASHAPVLTLTGLAGATTTSIGDLTAAGSFNSGTVALNAAAGGNTTLQGANLARGAGATLVVSPRNATSLAASELLTFSGSGTTLVNGILPPWLALAQNNGDFATYGGSGVQRCGYAAAFNPALSTQVVAVATSTALAAPQTAYASRLAANLNLNGNTLSLGDGTTGGLILLNGVTLSNSGGSGTLAVTGELAAYVDGANAATISAPFSGSGVLRKFGSGTLTLTSPDLPAAINPAAGALVLNPTADVVYPSAVNGAATLYKDGTSGLVLRDTVWTLGRLWLRRGDLALSRSAVTNLNTLTVGPSAQYTYYATSLAITNGSRCMQANGGAIVGTTPLSYTYAYNNAVLVAGDAAPSTWDLGAGNLTIGQIVGQFAKATNNVVTVTAGGNVTNAATVYVGNGSGGTHQRLHVTGGGRLFCTGLTVGLQQPYCTAEVRDAGSLVEVGGGALVVGQRNDTMVNNCSLSVSGGMVTNVGTFTVGTAGGNASTAVSNSVAISNGGAVHSTGTAVIGTLTGSGGAVGSLANAVRVTGAGSRWTLGRADLTVGYGQQGYSTGNQLVAADGGTVTNANVVYIGRVNARSVFHCALTVTNGSAFHSFGSAYIGHVHSGSTSPHVANSNRVSVAGGAAGLARWSLNGAGLTLGLQSKSGCSAVGNVLHVGRGGVVTNINALTVGSGSNSRLNRLQLAGGSVRSASLTVAAENVLAPLLDAGGLTPMSVSGTATFASGSVLGPSAAPGTPGGTYTVLVASTLTDNGLTLDPAVDPGEWSFDANPATDVLTVTYRPRGPAGTVILLR